MYESPAALLIYNSRFPYAGVWIHCSQVKDIVGARAHYCFERFSLLEHEGRTASIGASIVWNRAMHVLCHASLEGQIWLLDRR